MELSNFFHRRRFEVFMILTQPRGIPFAAARALAPDRNVEREILEIIRTFAGVEHHEALGDKLLLKTCRFQ